MSLNLKSNMEVDGSHVQTLVTSVLSALTAAVIFLFRLVWNTKNDAQRTARELGEFKGRQEGVETLSKHVLDVVAQVSERAAGKAKEDC